MESRYSLLVFVLFSQILLAVDDYYTLIVLIDFLTCEVVVCASRGAWGVRYLVDSCWVGYYSDEGSVAAIVATVDEIKVRGLVAAVVEDDSFVVRGS